MFRECWFSEKKCSHRLIVAIVPDGEGNVYEKFVSPDELEIIYHNFEGIENVWFLPAEITIFVHDSMKSHSDAKDNWDFFIRRQKPSDQYNLSEEDKQSYTKRYNALKDRNGWTDEWLNSFVQTGIYFEPEFDWDS